MCTKPEHDALQDSIAAYLLGACDEAEARMVRAHVANCADCRALAARLSVAVEALPLAAGEVRPPERLRGRILAAAEADEERGRVIQLPSRRALSQRRRMAYGAVAAVVVAGVIALGTWSAELSRPSQYTLSGTGTLASASGQVTMPASRDAASVRFSGLPAAGDGRVYELWLIDAQGRSLPGPVFTPNANGTATVKVDRSLKNVTGMAVTPESGPAGVASPTVSKPELAGQV